MAGPKRATAFSFGVALTSQADPNTFVATPTIAAADVQVSKDGGQFANIAVLPTILALASGADSGVLYVTLTEEEMTADKVLVLFRDDAGAEWQSLLVFIDTETGTISEIADYTDDIGVAGAGLTALGDARLANLDAAVSSRSTVTVAQVNAEADTALADYGAAIPGDAMTLDDNAITGGKMDATATAEIAAAAWGYVPRTLTTVARTSTAETSGTMSIHIGSYYSKSVTGLGSLSGRTAMVMTIKERLSDTDAAAVLQIRETTGVTVLNGAASGFTASDGTITVTDAATGALTIEMHDALTADLPCASQLVYDIKQIAADGESRTMETGTVTISRTATLGIA